MLNRGLVVYLAPDTGHDGAQTSASSESQTSGSDNPSEDLETTPGESSEQTSSGKNQGSGNQDTISREDYQHLLKVHQEMKAKFKAREEEDHKKQEQALKEQGKYKELYETTLPKYGEASKKIERYEGVLNTLLETEMKGVPKEYHDLIPDGDPVDRLEWIAKAKVSGMFSRKATGDGSPPPENKGSSTGLKALYAKQA